MQYTVKEHFVPQFIITNFSDANGKICIIKKASPQVRIITSPKKICFENDMYESKNKDGTYYSRNSIEKKFAEIEGELSARIDLIVMKLEKGESLLDEDDAVLAVLIALQLVRTPLIKRSVLKMRREKNVSDIEVYSIYRMMVDSFESGIGFLERNGFNLSNEEKQKIHCKSLIDEALEYMFYNCDFYIIKASGCSFVLSDNPVLIDKYENAKYILPITPNYAIVCALLDDKDDIEYGCLRSIEEDEVNRINRYSYENAEKLVIFNPSDGGYTIE